MEDTGEPVVGADDSRIVADIAADDRDLPFGTVASGRVPIGDVEKLSTARAAGLECSNALVTVAGAVVARASLPCHASVRFR
jgi:hypothetical protein